MFITLEGVEGSGKSTQAELLKEFLQKQGRKVTLTREPGWGALGRLIRRLLLEEKDLELHPLAELYLFCADRTQHVRDFVLPKLTILLNIPVKVGLSRLEKREGKTKMDEEPLEFHERVRQGYIFIAQKEPKRVKVVNATRDIYEIQQEIRNIVLSHISK